MKKFPHDLEFFKEQAFFVSSSSGWITKKLFVAFAIYFIREISLFRIQNNISEEIWLILDGHKSRIEYREKVIDDKKKWVTNSIFLIKLIE